MSKGKLYLIPSPLGDNEPAEVLPASVLEILPRLDCFVVEEVRTARRFLSRAGLKGHIEGLEFHELNEHTTPAEIAPLGRLFDVALSTQLFNNRVVVNGTIGNRRLYGTTTDEVAGDLDIDIKLDKPGTFRLNLFSHSADQYTSFLDNSQRNGVGFAYQREFNSLREFFRDLFTPRREREALEALQPVERTVLQIDTAGKAHPIVVIPANE